MDREGQILDYLQLSFSAGVGAVKFHQLIAKYGSAGAAVAALPPDRRAPRFKAEAELEKARRGNTKIILDLEADYPPLLRLIESAPPLIYVRGRQSVLRESRCVAIVGSRNASIPGRKTASRIAHDLTEAGVTVVSGMARGIDAAAHKGALYARGKSGATIAVLGTGADLPYPAENTALYQQIIEQGAVISELPAGTPPTVNNFPRRNRIVAGLAQLTLVVEATHHSGSLITARMSAEAGRHVGAVPGNPADARAQGPNLLLKQGARLIETAEDILPLLQAANHYQPPAAPAAIQTDFWQELPLGLKAPEMPEKNLPSTKIIDYLNFEGVYVDEIIRLSGQSPELIALQLLELEMSQKIQRLPGNRVALMK